MIWQLVALAVALDIGFVLGRLWNGRAVVAANGTRGMERGR